MSDYILVRDGGLEGHSQPLMTMGETDAAELLLGLAHSYDSSLCIYYVPSLYDMRNGGERESRKVTLADLIKPKAT